MTASIFLQVLSTGMEPQNVLHFIVTVFSKPIGVSEYKITSSLPDFIFDGVRLSISRRSISYVGKKCNTLVLNAIDIFADGVVYYIIN